MKIKYDNELRKLTLIYDNSFGKVLISNSILRNMKIIMLNKNKYKKVEYKKTYNLTGCLTIMDTKLDDVSFIGENFNCEDTINFIRAEGSIKEIEINNSNSDAIDADFSKIKIKNLIVNLSKNDCLDVSYGIYEISNINAENCGDKGVSVGEMSILNSNKVLIKNTPIGLASKDGSKAMLIKFDGINLNKCLSAYKKKQEFSGGYISVMDFKCENYKIEKNYDKHSTIKFLDN